MSAPDTAGSVLEEAAAWLRYQFSAATAGQEPRGPAPRLAALAELKDVCESLAHSLAARKASGLDWPVHPDVSQLLARPGAWEPADWQRLLAMLAARPDLVEQPRLDERRRLATAVSDDLLGRGRLSAATWARLQSLAPYGAADADPDGALIV